MMTKAERRQLESLVAELPDLSPYSFTGQVDGTDRSYKCIGLGSPGRTDGKAPMIAFAPQTYVGDTITVGDDLDDQQVAVFKFLVEAPSLIRRLLEGGQ